ncbi:MAG: hypothetical protein MR355_00340 [Lachnospiraceae bacterium]|nr:hypothetical protein [Lachnospiraceae bacterium]
MYKSIIREDGSDECIYVLITDKQNGGEYQWFIDMPGEKKVKAVPIDNEKAPCISISTKDVRERGWDGLQIHCVNMNEEFGVSKSEKTILYGSAREAEMSGLYDASAFGSRM